jgi:formamidopyrimidine-DNA glycosylase
VPEGIEVEYARRLIEERALAREIAGVDAPDAWYLKRGLIAAAVDTALPGHRFTAARRHGKLLLLDTDRGGPTLGLHLGMSGRVLIDDEAAGDPLIYGSNLENPAWHRFTVHFSDGGSLALRDPRRLGAVELDPDEERLGPDALTITQGELDHVITRSRAPVKAVLMDQARIAGLGNLLVDEVLWRAGIDPLRPARDLDRNERRRLHRAIGRTLTLTLERGGSHTGDHMAQRMPGGLCPKDGTPFERRTVAGRTTFSCPKHQR